MWPSSLRFDDGGAISFKIYELVSLGVDITESFGVESSALSREDFTAFGDAATRQIWPYPAHNDCSRVSDSTSRSLSASRVEAISCGEGILGIVVVVVDREWWRML